MFERTTAINKMLAMTARKKVVQGGTSSGKTYGIIPILIDYATKNPRQRITVVAESIPAVKDGAVKIFTDIMFDTNRWIQDHWIGNPMQYTFTNGTVIQFKSFDSVGKAKAAGKRDVLFLNEANHIDFEIADALMIRSKQTWIDFNPDAEFWAHTEVLKQPSSEFLLLTYEDNEALPIETYEDLMHKKELAKTSKYWANWCRVYIDGEIGNLQGAVFENWETAPIPDQSRLLYYGCDFGFATSKFAVVAVYNYNNTFYIKELVYQTNLTNQDAAALMIKNGYQKGMVVYCDYAEPKSIEELRRAGINAVPCDSKQDIKQFAIQKLNSQKFFVDEKSINLVEELRYYIWDEKTGKPKKSDRDHCMDALTYAIGSAGKYSGNYR
jgi:phage terminase large subunit